MNQEDISILDVENTESLSGGFHYTKRGGCKCACRSAFYSKLSECRIVLNLDVLNTSNTACRHELVWAIMLHLPNYDAFL